MYHYIAFEGVIGAGKTTFAKEIASKLQTRLLLEQFEDNPFLESFYLDKDKFSFPAELSFLASRYHQLKDVPLNNDLFQDENVDVLDEPLHQRLDDQLFKKGDVPVLEELAQNLEEQALCYRAFYEVWKKNNI